MPDPRDRSAADPRWHRCDHTLLRDHAIDIRNRALRSWHLHVSRPDIEAISGRQPRLEASLIAQEEDRIRNRRRSPQGPTESAGPAVEHPAPICEDPLPVDYEARVGDDRIEMDRNGNRSTDRGARAEGDVHRTEKLLVLKHIAR